MKLYNKIAERVNENYLKAQVPGTHAIAPRQGYFFISSISVRKIGLFGETHIAQVNWKPKIDDVFVEDLIFEIALRGLFSAKPEETKDYEIQDLISKVLFIYHPVLINKIFNGKEQRVLNCQWYVINDNSVFINERNAALHAFIGTSKTLKEACQNFANTAGYDVAEAEEYEAQYGYCGDSPIEENAFSGIEIIEEIPDNTPKGEA